MISIRIVNGKLLIEQKNQKFMKHPNDFIASIKRKILFVQIIVLVLGFSSCYYDIEEDLYPDYGCDLTNIRYSSDIVPLLNRYCYSCHSQSAKLGNIILEGYDQMIKYVNDGSLIGSIRHDAGWKLMPEDAPKIPDCDIMKITEWINSGKLNN